MYVWGSTAPKTAPLALEVDTNCLAVLIINTRSRYVNPFSKKRFKKDFREVLMENEDLFKETVPPFEVVDLNRLNFSTDQCQKDWVRLARVIKDNYSKYRGFVVHNGKDSMVSTATALSFMLENLGKPVIFTGSVISCDLIYTDLKRNINVALLFANCTQLSEVCILFDDRLFRANRTVKMYRPSLLPFDSPHFPPLATMHGTMRMHMPFIRPFPRGRFGIMENMDAVVLTLKLGPSLEEDVLHRAIDLTEARGIVLVAYGNGNGPSRGDYMKKIIQHADGRGIVVVVCTQNIYGCVDLYTYATGKQLHDAGAISAQDMTIDATIMKLKYLLGTGASPLEIRNLISENLRGEITPLRSKM